MADRLTGIETFVLAIRLGSLSAAARSMGISAAMAAKHLAALEERLNVTLVHRTTRRLSLTEAGADYLDMATRILSDLHEAETEISARSVAVEGLLRVSAPVTFGVMHLAPLAAEFGRLQPGLSLELGLNDRYVDLLDEHWDVAIRIGRLADSTLIARKLAAARLTLCAAPAYLARHGTPRRLADLGQHNCLGYTLAPLVGDSVWAFGPDGDIRVPIHGTFHANNGEALLQAALAGLGIVYAPRFMAAGHIASGGLVEFGLDTPLMQLGGVYAVTHPSRRPAAKTRAWIDFLVAHMPRIAGEW